MRKITLAFILLALIFQACTPEKKIRPSGNVITIGILAPLSRANRKYGYQSLLGIEFANRHKTYLRNGDKVVFEIQDTKSSPEGTQEALQTLVDKNVTAIISFVGSGNMIALKNMLQKIKIPMIVTLATNDEISKINNSIAQICMSNQREALVAAHYIKDEKFINSVGILYYSDNAYSLSLATQFQKYYKKIRGKDTFFLDFSQKEALKKLENENMKDVRIIFSVLSSKDTAKVLKVLRRKGVPLLLSDGTFSSAKESVKDDLHYFNGAYIIEHYASNMRGNRDYKKLQKLLATEHLEDSSYAFLAYDAYELLYYALQNCPKHEQKCINALFQNSDTIEGIAGNFSMQNAKVKRKIYIDKIENLRLKRAIVTY